MASQDIKNNVKFVGSIAPQAATGDVTGSAVDVSGFESVMAVFHGDGTAVGTVKITESDTSGGTYTDVAAADIIGTQGSDLDATDTAITIGYIGSKSFLKAVFTHATNGDVSGGFILGTPNIAPVSGNDN